jgi:hypothetical protein
MKWNPSIKDKPACNREVLIIDIYGDMYIIMYKNEEYGEPLEWPEKKLFLPSFWVYAKDIEEMIGIICEVRNKAYPLYERMELKEVK